MFSTEVFAASIALIHGFCFFALSFVSDLEEQMNQFNKGIIAAQKKSLNGRQQLRMRKRLGAFIEFHGVARELSILFFFFYHSKFPNSLFVLLFQHSFTIQISKITGECTFNYLTYMITAFGSMCLMMKSVSK